MAFADHGNSQPDQRLVAPQRRNLGTEARELGRAKMATLDLDAAQVHDPHHKSPLGPKPDHFPGARHDQVGDPELELLVDSADGRQLVTHRPYYSSQTAAWLAWSTTRSWSTVSFRPGSWGWTFLHWTSSQIEIPLYCKKFPPSFLGRGLVILYTRKYE